MPPPIQQQQDTQCFFQHILSYSTTSSSLILYFLVATLHFQQSPRNLSPICAVPILHCAQTEFSITRYEFIFRKRNNPRAPAVLNNDALGTDLQMGLFVISTGMRIQRNVVVLNEILKSNRYNYQVNWELNCRLPALIFSVSV